MPSNPADGRFEYDAVIVDLISNPAEVPATKMLVGLLGPGAQDDYCRLYYSTELRDFLDIRKEDVLLSRSLRTPENPLGGTAIWVRAEAEISISRRNHDGAEERFLTGQITAQFLQGATASGLAMGGRVFGGGLKSVPPVESCVPALCMPAPDPPGTSAVCTLSTSCKTQFLCF